MKKILITGNTGSGKTTFGKHLARSLELRSHGLDSIVWKPGWQKTSSEEKREKIQALINEDSRIIEGVSSQAFLAADTIFFLDMPLHRCLFNILRRFLANGLGTRDSLPANCPEYLGVFKAIRIAFIYQKSTRPHILELIAEHKQKKVIWIKSYRDLEKTL